jgi:hypothetical protein
MIATATTPPEITIEADGELVSAAIEALAAMLLSVEENESQEDTR